MCFSLDLTLPSLRARSLYIDNMCVLFDYAGYAAARALVETKKKQDILSLNTNTGYAASRALVTNGKKDMTFHNIYTVFLCLELDSPSPLAESLHTNTCLPFLTTRATRQPELWSKGRKNNIYYPLPHTQATRQPAFFVKNKGGKNGLKSTK